MKRPYRTALFALALSSTLSLPATLAQTPATVSGTDVYHVLFAKAAPGQAAALEKELQGSTRRIRWVPTFCCCATNGETIGITV
jgi:hypothetical protein